MEIKLIARYVDASPVARELDLQLPASLGIHLRDPSRRIGEEWIWSKPWSRVLSSGDVFEAIPFGDRPTTDLTDEATEPAKQRETSRLPVALIPGATRRSHRSFVSQRGSAPESEPLPTGTRDVAPDVGPDTVSIEFNNPLNKKPRLWRGFRRCRRRDSNPRHADYDSAALTS
jgi:hypothetical protein